MKTETQKSLPKKLPGTVQKQFIKCGKPTCKCTRGELHGAYYFHFVYMEGKLRKRYLKAAEVEVVRAACLLGQAEKKCRIKTNRTTWTAYRELRDKLRTVSAQFNKE